MEKLNFESLDWTVNDEAPIFRIVNGPEPRLLPNTSHIMAETWNVLKDEEAS